MVITVAFIAAAWVLSRPQLQRGPATQSILAVGLAGFTLLTMFYFGRFK